MTKATDRSLAALSRRLAGRLVLDLSKTGRVRSTGIGRLTRSPATETSSDLDFDASLDGILTARAEDRPVSFEDLVATRWEKPLTAICLLIDRSGSMNGERLASAALAAAVCAWRAPGDFAVMAFGSRVVELKSLNAKTSPEEVVAKVLSLQGHGTTDVDLALRAAGNQLRNSRAKRRVTILLSDAEVTAGADPVASAKSLDELIILAPDDSPALARELAAACGGRMAEVGGPLSVLNSLRSVLQ